ncbi:unnamed protein product, partial [marine sediment metagenome]
GTMQAKKLIEERSGEFPDEFKELVLRWEYRIQNYNSRKQHLSAFDIVLICIYFIFNKGKINFFLNAFHYVIDKENSYFSKHRKKLIALEYITEYQKTANSFKEINVTPKGRERAEKLIYLMKRDYNEKFQKLISEWEERYDEYLKIIKKENQDSNF